MKIPINNRVVLIIGPTTSGKSTMAKKIQRQFEGGDSILISHDEILKGVNKNQSQEEIDLEFRIKYIIEVQEAIENQKNKLVIIDALSLQNKNLWAMLSIIKTAGFQDKVTVLKTDLPIKLHFSFWEQRNDQYFREQTTREELYNTIIEQVGIYHSPYGSLNQHFSDTDEIIIQDPRKIEFTYPNITSKQYQKTSYNTQFKSEEE